MDHWQVLATRPLLDRPPWMSVWEEDVKLPNGLLIEHYLRSLARDYAMVFAVLPDGKVPLITQYKHGVGAVCRDLPAGYLSTPIEPPLSAAQRELREETGLTARTWRSLGHLVVDTNRGATRAHIFLATDVESTGQQELDPTEQLNVTYHAPGEVREMVVRGEIDLLASVAGIMLALAALGACDQKYITPAPVAARVG
jgi:8-oxo-dGTP pyrophosphatase MutT (NUDIX family)